MTKNILLADDSLTIQKVVELTFADTPYTVVSVSSGDELLQRIPEVRPDIIICDIIMPGRDGYEVCQDIKSSPDTLHIPVILLSGTFEPLDRNRALAVGSSEILSKPFEARKLIDAVDRLLRHAEEPRSAAGGGARFAETGPVGATTKGDFGTRLSETDAGELELATDDLSDGLDFTETGFADMQSAAERRADSSLELPREGLEFEMGAGEIDPFSDFDAAEDQAAGAGLDDAFDIASEPFAGGADSLPPFGDDSVFGDATDVDVSFAGGTPAKPETSNADTGPAFGPVEAAPAPAAAAVELDTRLDEPAAAPGPDLGLGAGAPFTGDTDTAPLPPLEAPAEAEAAPAAAPPGMIREIGELSEEDVDRIARRLLELADEKIVQIAWEVIPDVAEVVVRERIRRLEAELETES